MSIRVLTAGSFCLGLIVLAHPQPASAAGCGGYVNVFVSGCAPWDNNPRRLPGAPGYQAPRTAPVAAPRIVTPPTRLVSQPTVIGGRIVGDHGGGLISNSRGSVISNGSSTLIGNDGSTMRRR